MLTHGYMINVVDKCIYNKFINNEGVIICLYVCEFLEPLKHNWINQVN